MMTSYSHNSTASGCSVVHCPVFSNYSATQVDEELGKLMALLPGLELRFERMKADLVMQLLTQPQNVAACLVALRAALPDANVAVIATTLPSLLTSKTPEELTASVQSIRYSSASTGFCLLLCSKLIVLFQSKICSERKSMKLSSVEPYRAIVES